MNLNALILPVSSVEFSEIFHKFGFATYGTGFVLACTVILILGVIYKMDSDRAINRKLEKASVS